MSGKKGRSGRKPKPKPEELSLMPSASDPDIPLTTDDSESIVVTADGPVDPNVAVQFENEINLDRLLSGVAQGDGYYAKVYRKYPLPPEYAGRLLLLQSFDLAGIDDLESHLLRMAQKNKWERGVYQLRLFQHGRSGVVAQPRNVSLDPALAEDEPKDDARREEAMRPGDRLKETLEIAHMAREAFGATTTDPTALAKALGEAVSLGARAVNPEDRRGGAQDQIIAALLTAALNRPDPLQQIVAAKQAGLLPEPKSQDQSLLEQITAIKTIVEALGGLGGGGGEDKTSPTVELIRALAPQAAQIVGSLTQAVGKFMDYQSAKLRVGSGQNFIAGSPGLGEATPVPSPAVPSVSAQPALPTPPRPEDEMFAFVNEISRRARGKEYEFFPQLLHGLEAGPFAQLVVDHASGKLTDAEILSFLGNSIPQFGDQTAQEYLAAFLHWHTAEVRPNGRTEPEPAFVGACQTCGEEYGFESHDEYSRDSKICDSKRPDGSLCNGQIIMKVAA